MKLLIYMKEFHENDENSYLNYLTALVIIVTEILN